MPKASPHAYHRVNSDAERMTSKTPLFIEIAVFMHSHYEETGRIPTKQIVLDNTSATRGREVARAIQILRYNGEIDGSIRWGDMVKV